MTEAEVEIEIAEHLQAKRSVEAIVNFYCKKILDPTIDFTERAARIRFIYLAGYDKNLLEVYSTALTQGVEMPFSYLADSLSRAKQEVPDETIRNILADTLTEVQGRDLARAAPWAHADARISAFKKQQFDELIELANIRRDQLRDRLTFYQNQRMVNEERKLLNFLLKVYPDDPEFLRVQNDFSERWARQVISQASLNQLDTAGNPPVLADDQWPMAGALLEEATRLADEDKSRVLDLTLLFWFLELYPQALIILDKGDDHPQLRWLRIELLLKLRRFVDTLDELSELERKFTTDPEISFAATYYRAQALHGLGQTTQALDIMKSLINVRPEYRSARSFVSKWSEGQATE